MKKNIKIILLIILGIIGWPIVLLLLFLVYALIFGEISEEAKIARDPAKIAKLANFELPKYKITSREYIDYDEDYHDENNFYYCTGVEYVLELKENLSEEDLKQLYRLTDTSDWFFDISDEIFYYPCKYIQNQDCDCNRVIIKVHRNNRTVYMSYYYKEEETS